jgi:hypothetical protein
MRPVGKRRLLRYEVAQVVAEEPMIVQRAHVSNLLMPTKPLPMGPSMGDIKLSGIKTLRVTILRNWDGLADSGGSGGSRLSFVPEPFIAA